MDKIPSLKLQCVELEVEFEIIAIAQESCENDPRKQEIDDGLRTVNSQLSAKQQKRDALNKEIDNLTNHADGFDYMVAVGSGLLAGLIDSFWVGSFDFEAGKAWSNKQVNNFVMKVAKGRGFEGNRLKDAIAFLEKEFKIFTDNIWKGQDLGISARSHHIDDMAHHPSPIGLFFSILTQFTKHGYFQNNQGEFLSITTDENGGELIGTGIPSKIFAGTVNWFFHLVSDMSGSKKTAGAGMGIPGPIISLLKELSAIPGFNKSGLAKQVHQAFVKNKFDFRSELAVGHELARQAVPVVLNEVIVCSFYFIRRLTREVQEKKDFASINWENTLPWKKNRTIVRMLTIATGTFTLVDIVDAAIRAQLKANKAAAVAAASGPAGAAGAGAAVFVTEFLLHVNFVGVGRFAIAVGTDVSMGIRRNKLRTELMYLNSEMLHLMNAKIFYSQAGMWIEAETAQQAITEMLEMMEQSIMAFQKTIRENEADLARIGQYASQVKKQNPGLVNDILRELEF